MQEMKGMTMLVRLYCTWDGIAQQFGIACGVYDQGANSRAQG